MNNTLHTIKNIIIVFVLLGITFFLLGYLKTKNTTPVTETPKPEARQREPLALTSLKGITIYIDEPLPDALVTSPLTIRGRAPGNWFFEASAPVTITNWDGLIIGESFIQAEGEWMTTDYVPFVGTLEFTNTEYGDYGFLILQKDNPSGEPQFDDSIEFKVKFK